MPFKLKYKACDTRQEKMKRKKIRYIVFIVLFGLLGCSGTDFDLWQADRFSNVSDAASRASLKSYIKALKKNPQGDKADLIRVKISRLYLKAGEFSLAIDQLRQAGSLESKRLLASALLKSGDHNAALEVFNKCGSNGSDSYLFDYAVAAEKSNLFDQALKLYSLVENDARLKAKAQERILNINLMSAKSKFAGVDEEVRKIIEGSSSQKEYPDASSIYLLVDENIELTADDRQITEFHYCLKILNDRGKEKFAEIEIPYDSTYERLELEYARTIMPDGTVVTVGDKNIRDVSVYLNFPLYSNARVRIISMPEVVSGACIEYKAKVIRSKLPNKSFDSTYWLQADEPILLERSRISIPEGKSLKHKVVNGVYNTFGFDLTPSVALEGGKKIYSVEFKDVPAIMPEPFMPYLSRVDPYIIFSTFENWQDIYSWWKNLYLEKISEDADIRKKALDIVKDKKTKEEKARAIYNFCVEDIRYVAVEYGDAGYEPHAAGEIFKNKYGDCKDKVILFISMLKCAGIDAFPVLVSTFDSLDVEEDVPSLNFNHCIAALELDNKLVFLDITAATTSFGDLPAGDQDRLVLVFFKDRYKLLRTPLFDHEHNKISTFMKIKMNNDESVECFREVKAKGIYEQAQRFWLKFTMPTLIEEELKHKARLIAPGAVLKNHEIRNVIDLNKPVYLSYAFAAPQYLKKAGSTRIMDQLGGMESAGVFK